MNVAEVLLMSLTIVKKHSCTWGLLLDVYQMINSIHENSVLPKTKYMLRQLIGINTDSITYHLLCSKCDKYMGEEKDIKKK